MEVPMRTDSAWQEVQVMLWTRWLYNVPLYFESHLRRFAPKPHAEEHWCCKAWVGAAWVHSCCAALPYQLSALMLPPPSPGHKSL